jgi:hypothetical protein
MAVMLTTPAASHAGYGEARWGMRIAEVKRLFPGGQTIVYPSQEEMYRVVVQAFGAARAVATFAFDPVHHLNVVVFEFPDGQPRVAEADYARPSRDAATTLRTHLARALTAKYGKSTHERIAVGGRTQVWRGRAEFVRMQTVVVGDGEDVRVWVEDNRQHVRATDRQKLFDWPRNRTDPATWSATGALGVKWGMGLGDILEKYPNLSSVSFAEDATKTFSTDAFVEAPVRVYFEFFAGRLVEVHFSQVGHSENNLLRDMTDEQQKMYEEGIEYWRTRVLEILTAKYGPPIEEPSETHLAAAMNDEGFSDVMWRWVFKDMGVAYIRRNARVQLVKYMNIGPLGRAAYEAEQAFEAAKEAERNAKF